MQNGNDAAAGARSQLVSLIRGTKHHHPPTPARDEAAKRQIELVPLARLSACKTNARTHSPKQVRQIAASIERFGFTVPILVNAKNEILAGHGRVEAAKLLGVAEVPALRLSHLSAVDQRAYILADNRLAELAGWDRDALVIELQGLIEFDFPVELTGFDMGEIELMLHDNIEHEDANAKTGSDSKRPKSTCQTAVSRSGDVWLLGAHRLACGDGCDARGYAAIDAAIRTWQKFTDTSATLAGSGGSFDQTEKERCKPGRRRSGSAAVPLANEAA